jgi:hypothetical protein
VIGINWFIMVLDDVGQSKINKIYGWSEHHFDRLIDSIDWKPGLEPNPSCFRPCLVHIVRLTSPLCIVHPHAPWNSGSWGIVEVTIIIVFVITVFIIIHVIIA